MIKTKIQLINPPLNKDYSFSLRTGIYAPLNLATLAGYIEHYDSSIEIEILDGEMESWDIFLMKINASVVGISCNIMTYESTLKIAEYAYSRGCKVVLGGPFATSLPEEILKQRPFIDAVIAGDGEKALLDYVQGKPYNSIPNLVYRDGKDIVRNRSIITNISTLPLPDYSSLNMKGYFSNYKIRYGIHKPFNGSFAISSIKGCHWRDVSEDGCIFCMIPNKGVQYSNCERIWHEIKYLKELYDIDYFWDVSDSFVDNKEWLEEFYRTKPENLDVGFEIYGRANTINEKKAKLLKDIGVFEVFVGAESGDEQILKNINKPVTKKLVLRAIEALRSYNIKATVSFVIGLPGETHQSLANTIRFAEQLSNYENVIETSTSVMMPIPGSRAFKDLMQVRGMKEKHSGDRLDLEEIRRDWIRNFTKLTYKDLEKGMNDVTSMFVLNSNFSQPKHKYISAPDC